MFVFFAKIENSFVLRFSESFLVGRLSKSLDISNDLENRLTGNDSENRNTKPHLGYQDGVLFI
jgi:hypothetical protein